MSEGERTRLCACQRYKLAHAFCGYFVVDHQQVGVTIDLRNRRQILDWVE
jgi:hypothetical protein